MPFAQKLQELRKAAGLSQEELAEKLGVSRQSVSKWELGQAYPETEKIIELSRMFGVSLDVLLKGAEPPASGGESPTSETPPPPGPKPHSWLLTALGVLAVLIVAVVALFVISWPRTNLSPSEESVTSSQLGGSGSVSAPASSAAPYDQPSDLPVSMEYLRGYYFDFARQYRLDYIPYFEEYQVPSDSTEYLFWAFAINLESWGEDKGTMSREYVDEMVLRHFGQRELEHQSMFKCWDFDGETYTAVPGGVKEQPMYLLTGYTTYEENGIRYHEVTLDYLLLTSGMIPTAEEDAALRERIISGSTGDLYALCRETFRYHLSASDPEAPVFDSHTLVSAEY